MIYPYATPADPADELRLRSCGGGIGAQADGRVLGFGLNTDGQLGTGTTKDCSIPIECYEPCAPSCEGPRTQRGTRSDFVGGTTWPGPTRSAHELPRSLCSPVFDKGQYFRRLRR